MTNWAGDRSVGDLLLDLEMRLSRVEKFLKLEPEEVAEAEEAVVAEPVAPPPVVEPAAYPVRPPPLPVMAQVQVAETVPAVPVAVVPAYEAAVDREPPEQTELEQTIGLKWAGWIGAVVVVIGAGLGIKYAYDQRWFEILPPAGRLALMSLGGFALLVAGEFVFRRIHRVAAACLFGAGVATLFLVSYAGHGYYRLYEPATAFVLMALTTAVGAGVAARGNLLSIAVLSQLGGNLAPLLLKSDHPILGSFLTYLLALQVVALTLTWWAGHGRWAALRAMSLATTSLWMLAVHGDLHPHNTALLLTYTLLSAALYHLELILSCASPRGGLPPGASAEPLSLSVSPTSPTGFAVTFSTLVTALLAVALLSVLRDFTDPARGAAVLSLACAASVLGVILSRSRSTSHPLYPLALAYRVQAAALVVVAVPVALNGVWVLFGWVALSLAFATLGNLLRLRISRWAGVMVWRLALLYLGWWTVGPITRTAGGVSALEAVGAHAVWLTLSGEGVRAYTILAWMLAAVGHTVAWLIHQEGLRPAEDADRKFQRLAWVTNVLAGVTFLTASIAGLPPVGATLAILVYAWLLLGADLLNPRLGLSLQSAVVVALLTIKWVAIDTLAERLAPGWSATARRPLFNAVMAVGVLISATMAALYWLRRDVLWGYLTRRSEAPEGAVSLSSPTAPILALAAALMTLFTIGLTVEIDRVVEAARPGGLLWPAWQLKQMSWTILWTLSLSAYVALARRLEPDDWRRPDWAWVAEGLIAVVAMKFLIIDTLFFRAFGRVPPAFPLANFQVLTAAVVVGGMLLVAFRPKRPAPERARSRSGGLPALAGFLAILVVLWGGTLEIDRFFERLATTGGGPFARPGLAKQVAFSIFWSLFAVGAIVAGFRFRTKGLRYFGLGLFAVTLLKVVFFDMSDVQTGYRVLSFLGLGLLLMGTSVLYGKLSPLLLRDRTTGTA